MSKYEGHTPGPWRYDSNTNSIVLAYKRETPDGYCPNAWHDIGKITSKFDYNSRENERIETKANGLLIADAPMLAEKLEIMTRAYEQSEQALHMVGQDATRLAEQNAKMLAFIKEAFSVREWENTNPEDIMSQAIDHLSNMHVIADSLIAEIEGTG